MYDDKNLLYLLTMLECCEKIWIYSNPYENADDFLWAEKQQPLNATISLLIAIGEESKKVDTALVEKAAKDFDWKSVAKMRDKISHNYRGINAKVLWKTIHTELYLLKDVLMRMIAILNLPKALLQDFISSSYYEDVRYIVDSAVLDSE